MVAGVAIACGGSPAEQTVPSAQPGAAAQDDERAPDAAETAPPGDARVTLSPVASAVLRGEVIAARKTGRAAPAIEALAVLRSEGDLPTLESPLDGEGRFFFGPVPPGAYELAIRTGGEIRTVRAVVLEDGDTAQVTIELPLAQR